MSYKSWLYQTLETLVFFIPSLIFNTPVQKQLITVELSDNYFSDPVRSFYTFSWVVCYLSACTFCHFSH